MPAGRPLKFETVGELRNASDGFVEIPSIFLDSKDFDREKDLEEYIVNNMEKCVHDLFDDELVSFEVDKLIDRQRFGPRGRRVDLVIRGKKKVYLVELKNPSSGTENRCAIGQILDYGREFLDPKKELVIITTKFDMNTAETIRFYNLPIRYIYLEKNRFLESI